MALGAICLGLGALAAGAAVTADPALVVDPLDNTALTTPQASNKLFTLSLPIGATCPGNTATGGFRYYSFLVPQGTDPSSLTFGSGIPSAGLGLVRVTGDYFIGGGANTSNTGLVADLPVDFDFAAGVPGQYAVTGEGGLIPTGSSAGWVGGIACTDTTGVVTNYWASSITFTTSTTDPLAFVWSAEAVGGGTTTTTSVGTTTTSTSSTSITSTSTTTPTSTTSTSTTTPTSGLGSTTSTTLSSSSGGGFSSSSSSGGGTLAATGIDSRRLEILGALLLGIGIVLVLVSAPRVALEQLAWPDER